MLNGAIFERLWVYQERVTDQTYRPPFDELMHARSVRDQKVEQGSTFVLPCSDPSTGRLATALFGQGSSKAVMVEVLGRYSNPRFRPDYLRSLAVAPKQGPQTGRDVVRKQQQRRLSEVDVEVLVASYNSGETLIGLARRFGINRATVLAHLDRQGVQRRQPQKLLGPEQFADVSRRYLAGETLTQIAVSMEIGVETVRQALVDTGTPRRKRGRRGSRGQRR